MCGLKLEKITHTHTHTFYANRMLIFETLSIINITLQKKGGAYKRVCFQYGNKTSQQSVDIRTRDGGSIKTVSNCNN